jgi:hypothetical protein
LEVLVNAQEIELWARDTVVAVLANQPIEDSRIELKSSWPEPRKAADRMAGQANAARGVPILWLIGVDEKNQRLTNVDPLELSSWYKSVERFFDGFAPRLAVDVNVRIGSDTVVALYFETEQGAPYVVEFTKGSYPEFVVPWREGTGLRAARRDDLLRILVPIRRLSALIDELNFNFEVTQATRTIASLGALFRDDEFHHALRNGVFATLPAPLSKSINNAYISIKRANHLVTAALAVAGQHRQPDQLSEASDAVRECSQLITNALERLSTL